MTVFQKGQKEEITQPACPKYERKEGRRQFGIDEKKGGFGHYEVSKGHKFASYTPLSAPRARILEEALQVELLPPKQQHTPPNADGRMYCRYHQNVSHNNEDCIALRDRIEELIRVDLLKKYVWGESQRNPPARGGRLNSKDDRCNRSRSRERPLRGHINTVSGGFAKVVRLCWPPKGT